MFSVNNNDNRYHKIVNLLEISLYHLLIAHERLELLSEEDAFGYTICVAVSFRTRAQCPKGYTYGYIL